MTKTPSRARDIVEPIDVKNTTATQTHPTPETENSMIDLRGALWSDAEREWLALHYGIFPMSFLTSHLVGRTPQAVRIMACRIRKERERVEAARKLRNVPRETETLRAIGNG